MSYYDYDYEAEPNYPEVEEIIEEATGKFDEFMHKAFMDEYKRIELAKENVSIREKMVQERLDSANKKERELQERETELNKSEQEQYEKLKTKWFTELGIAFDIGSTVYYIKDITQRVTCPACSGEKTVKAKIESADGTSSELGIKCPTCDGVGNIKGEKEFEIEEATVTEINARLCKSSRNEVTVRKYSNYSYELATFVWVKNKRGNDSRQINGNDLYKTKEEAEVHIKELLNKD